MSKYKYDITIAILNYNREKFLDRAVRSSVGQVLSGKNQEVIVIDDGSTDNSVEFLKKYNKTYKNSILGRPAIPLGAEGLGERPLPSLGSPPRD